MEGLNAVHMSLDEYIKVKGLDRQFEKPKEIFSEAPRKTESDVKSSSKDDENDDDANEFSDGDVFMKDCESSEVLGLDYMKADFDDIYSKSLNENTSNSFQIPFVKSNQWRSEPSNVNGADDMARIVSRNSPRKQYFFKKNGGGRYQKNNHNYANRKQYRNNNNNRRHRQNNGNGNYRGGGAGVKNYQNNQMQQNSEKTFPINGLLTLRARSLAMQKSAFKIQQQQQSSSSVQSFNSEESFSRHLAVNRQSAVFNIEKMPLTRNNVDTFAGNFMNFLNTYENVVHKPVYNLQIQGEIAEMQNKTIHCSNTGVVMPQSGTGIDCEIQPHASSTPLVFRHC